MAIRTGGARRRTRNKFAKERADKGKISIRRFLQTFEPGDKVELRAEPAYQGGIYHSRFHSKIGIIGQKKVGSCYEVNIKDGSVKKKLILHPVHLFKVKE